MYWKKDFDFLSYVSSICLAYFQVVEKESAAILHGKLLLIDIKRLEIGIYNHFLTHELIKRYKIPKKKVISIFLFYFQLCFTIED